MQSMKAYENKYVWHRKAWRKIISKNRESWRGGGAESVAIIESVMAK
jgi:hypothetical protein